MNGPLYIILGFAVLFISIAIYSIRETKKRRLRIQNSKTGQLKRDLEELKKELALLQPQPDALSRRIQACDAELAELKRRTEAILEKEAKIRAACGKGYALCGLFELIGARCAGDISRKLYALTDD